jgi:regulator of protease activity HflC (stomatin/prohibitin superfamily)
MKDRAPKFISSLIAFLGVLFVGAILAFSFFIAVVDAGEVGVVSVFGNVSDTPLQPGINLKNPFAEVISMSTRTEQYTMASTSGEGQKLGDDSIEGITSDGANIRLDVTVFYRLRGDSAPEVYKSLGILYQENIIRPEIRSTIREKVAQFTVIEVFSEKREELSTSIFDDLKESLSKRGIELEDVLLRDVALPEMLITSINEKLSAQQEAQKLDFLLDREKKEAERKVIEAKGQRDSQKIINESLTDKYLYYLYINALENLEGTVYVPTEGGVPLFKNID